MQAKNDVGWRDTMTKEFNAQVENNTRTLVPKNSSNNIVGNKWIFRVKIMVDDSVERLKARLVVKDFHKCPRIDFQETFVQ